MENQALDIIDMLYTMIAEAWGMPLGNDKCIIERDKALALLDDLKAQLPLELGEARRLVNARDDFVSNAKKEADTIRRKAEEDARALLSRESVYQEARRQADETIQKAETKSKEIFRAANTYLDDALRQTEETMLKAITSVQETRSKFRSVSMPEPEGTVDVSLDEVEDMDLMSE